MEVTGTTTAQTTTAAPSSGAETALSSDFETFLVMLTTQLENQDPLNPVDSADFAVQLATFSGVEQQVQTNDLLAALSAQLTTSGLSDYAAWVGKEALVTAPAYFQGAPITLIPDIDTLADAAELIVTDANGTEVQRVAIAANTDVLDWAGTTATGAPMPDGYYNFSVISYANGNVLNTTTVEHYATVTETRIDDGTVKIVLAGGVALPATGVSGLRE
jgi:flagellar basal-body rod modification protein FlgD